MNKELRFISDHKKSCQRAIEINKDLMRYEPILKEDYNTLISIEKIIKAFNIIKEKLVDVADVLNFSFIHENGCDFYNSYINKPERLLSYEEYDLLKELLK